MTSAQDKIVILQKLGLLDQPSTSAVENSGNTQTDSYKNFVHSFLNALPTETSQQKVSTQVDESSADDCLIIDEVGPENLHGSALVSSVTKVEKTKSQTVWL